MRESPQGGLLSLCTIKSVIQADSTCFATVKSDVWTSTANVGYLGVIFFLITHDWQPLEILVAVRPLCYEHRVALHQSVEFASDEGANMIATAKALRLGYLSCGCHVLQLTVQNILSEPDVQSLLSMIKPLISYFSWSSKATCGIPHTRCSNVPLPANIFTVEGPKILFPLMRWATSKNSFPHLAALARKYFCARASAASI
ncbi:hypothetical protein Pelo_6165 [Pelomyxa schiedti]|nr:hypothetical protein Pelo_6165 [Pelomyxa schiedti]